MGILLSLVEQVSAWRSSCRNRRLSLGKNEYNDKQVRKKKRHLNANYSKRSNLLILIVHGISSLSEIGSPHACVIFYLHYILDHCVIVCYDTHPCRF
jgi:hypothetical protein